MTRFLRTRGESGARVLRPARSIALRLAAMVAATLLASGCASAIRDGEPPAKGADRVRLLEFSPQCPDPPCRLWRHEGKSSAIERVRTGEESESESFECRLIGINSKGWSCFAREPGTPIMQCKGGGLDLYESWVIDSVPVSERGGCDAGMFRPVVLVPPSQPILVRAGQQLGCSTSLPIYVHQIFAPSQILVSVASPTGWMIDQGCLTGVVPNTPGGSVVITVRGHTSRGTADAAITLSVQ